MPGGGWLSVHEDITARQRAEDRIAEVLATFDATLANMPQGVALYDRQQRIVLANRRYAEMYGLAPEDVAPGTPMIEMLKKRAQKGIFLGSSESRVIDDLVKDMTKPSNEHEIERYADGRVIEKSRKPMPDGGWLSVHEDVTERVKAEDKIAWMAHHDALTRLANRVVLQKRLEEDFARHRRDGSEFALLLLDLDEFKFVNDAMGHPIGDKLLQVVADRLRATVRDVDLVARIGGDEFAIVLAHEADIRLGANTLAQRLMEAICAPYEIDGLPLRVYLSVGVGIAPLDGEDADALMQNADLALYQAKAAGRRTVRFYNADMDSTLREERFLENELRHALDRNELEVFHQKIVDVATGATIGTEALARWRHPKLGMVPPDRFIRVAERTGLIKTIGAWILGAACAQATAWPSHLRVAVNLSPSQFKSGDLVAVVTDTLRKTGLDARRLTLEITETTLLEKSDENLHVLEDLRALGIKIALDDFGTGFSSLSYLKTIRFDVIKIDRSFVAEMATNERSAHIIAGIVALSRALGFTTVAEGVETREHFDLVRAAGCTSVQGYLFSRPMPASQLVFDDVNLDARAA
jgi:diguanylate cyclase (GGDEF)-like protein/PAS domain S-box-containing protein